MYTTIDLSELQREKTQNTQEPNSDALESFDAAETTQTTTQSKCSCCTSKKHAGQSFDPKMLSEVENVIRQFESNKRS